jgi:hypothetical protein
MMTPADKTQESKSQSAANPISQNQSSGEQTFQLADNRPEAVMQRKLHEMANISWQQKEAAQLHAIANSQTSQLDAPLQKKATSKSAPKANNTGLPDALKSGIENLSGYSMDDVKVHRNSDKPAQLQALAYAQGTDIHLGPGQEKHLPHEAWHVVQQKQGRVKPTLQMKGKVNVNDDKGLEKEADVMGGKAMQLKAIQEMANNSPQAKHSAQLQAMADNRSVYPIQKQELVEEELLQGKFKDVQRQELEEEELLQGKFESIQKQELEEEEQLQGKFKTVQRQEFEEEKLLQGKYETIQRNSISNDAEEETEDYIHAGDNDEFVEHDPNYMPVDDILVEELQPFIKNNIGSCIASAANVRHKLMTMKSGRPYAVGAVKIEFETGTMCRNHTAVLASWEDGLFVIDTTMGQFNFPSGVLICPYTQWRKTLFESQPFPVNIFKETFKESGCFTEGDLKIGMSRFRGNEKIISGYKSNGESMTTEEASSNE